MQTVDIFLEKRREGYSVDRSRWGHNLMQEALEEGSSRMPWRAWRWGAAGVEKASGRELEWQAV